MTPSKSTSTPPRNDSQRRVRDPYADLLRDTRGLRREEASAREAWFAGLGVERKEESLFELEMLLKGLAAWSNPRNHPRRTDLEPLLTRSFRAHLVIALKAVSRCVSLCVLLQAGAKGAAIARSFPQGFSEEPGGEREQSDETPDAALSSLRQALAIHGEIIGGLVSLERVSFRRFYAALAGLRREVARNPFFNPLYALEFRPEFDRVRAPDVLDAILSVDGELAHRAVALGYLGAFRLLRMTALLQTSASEPERFSVTWVILAAVRAEARVFADTLTKRVPTMLSDSIERDILRVPAAEMSARYDGVARDCERLVRVRAALGAAGHSLRAEMRRVMTWRVPPCDEPNAPADVMAAFDGACVHLRGALQRMILQVTNVLRGAVDPERLFNDRNARRAAGERLRQAAWIFSLMTRAFIARAREVGATDAWDVDAGMTFVHDFDGYYEALGMALAHETGHTQVGELSNALAALRETDWINQTHILRAIAGCEEFMGHLRGVIDETSARDDLRAVTFDKAAAGETLRMYLGARLDA